MAKLTMTFYSDFLSQKKNHEIYLCANAILRIKNKLSSIIYNDIFKFYTMSLEEFSDYFIPVIADDIEEDFSLGVIHDLYFGYVNYFKEINKKLNFYDCNFGKKNQRNKKNINANFSNENQSAISLAQCLTYLARCNENNLIDNLLQGAESNFSNRSNFCLEILSYVEKYTLSRLMKVVCYKRNKILSNILPGPLKFTDYSFSGRSYLSGDIISPNRNPHSAIKGFIQLSWRNGGTIAIPVRLNNFSPEELKYISLCSTKIYRIRFERKGQISIVLHCEGSFIAPDTNSKNNNISSDVTSFFTGKNYSFCNFAC